MRLNYSIVLVREMNRSVSFYRDVIGLNLRFQSPVWTEFATEGATVALHLVEDQGKEETGPVRERAGSCRPGLSVPNLTEFHARMLAMNVRCVQEPEQRFGSRIAQYLDPDGLVIAVSEAKQMG
jgi:lactoylglutathione lyase